MNKGQTTGSAGFGKPKTKEQLADEMGLHPKTLQRHLKKADLNVPRGLIYPKEQMEIYERLGLKP